MRIDEIDRHPKLSTTGLPYRSDRNLNKFLEEKCPIAFKSDTKIFRGIDLNSNTKIYFGDSRTISRKSANTENYYTLIIDNLLPEWKKFPKRSRSFICSSNSYDADSYGTVYQVYPVGNPTIGICSANDFWYSFKNIQLDAFSGLFKFCAKMTKIKPEENLTTIKKIITTLDNNWKQILKSQSTYFLEELGGDLSIDVNDMYKFFSFSKLLATMLSPTKNNFEYCKLSRLDSLKADNRELWFSGPAYFVEVR